ncbi:hypothetical protein GQR58_021241 [Nymphon striatum]|nr:hypothetical protein GQR58_021241 [Nymphon striatum]
MGSLVVIMIFWLKLFNYNQDIISFYFIIYECIVISKGKLTAYKCFGYILDIETFLFFNSSLNIFIVYLVHLEDIFFKFEGVNSNDHRRKCVYGATVRHNLDPCLTRATWCQNFRGTSLN